MTQVLDLAKRLMAAPSVTPATGAVFDAIEAMLAPLGFEVTRFTRGEGATGTSRRTTVLRAQSTPRPKEMVTLSSLSDSQHCARACMSVCVCWSLPGKRARQPLRG